MMYDCGKIRSCATCLHKTPIGAQAPSACAGCIKGGACTRWEALRIEAAREDIHKSTT